MRRALEDDIGVHLSKKNTACTMLEGEEAAAAATVGEKAKQKPQEGKLHGVWRKRGGKMMSQK